MKTKTKYYKELGKKITIYRAINQMSQIRLGELLGLHQTAICRIEAGTQHLEISAALVFCQAIGIGIAALLDPNASITVSEHTVAERFGKPHLKALLKSKVVQVIPTEERKSL